MSETELERKERHRINDARIKAEMEAQATGVLKVEAKPVETKASELATVKAKLKEANVQYIAAIKAHRVVMKSSHEALKASLAVKMNWYHERIRLAQEKKRLIGKATPEEIKKMKEEHKDWENSAMDDNLKR